MDIKEQLFKIIRSVVLTPWFIFELIYLPIDKKLVRRTKNIRLIPSVYNRKGEAVVLRMGSRNWHLSNRDINAFAK